MPPLPTSLRTSLVDLLGDRFSTADSVREIHGRDESSLPSALPDAVCFPTSTDEVAAVVRACAAHRVPIVPFGAGTSLEGHVLAVHGGVCLDLSLMNRIVAIHDEDLDATVEAGVTRMALNRRLGDRGLFFPIDPGADATFGGMASTRASGTNAVRYGTMRENVLGLTVVLADGRVVRTARRARKSSAGYDLTRLFVGAEGTLGVITEVTVRLYGLPEAMSAAVVSFASIEAAAQTVIETIQLGVPVARIELLDEVMVDAINRYAGLDHTLAPTLMLEFHGTPAAVAEQAVEVGRIAAEHGGTGFRWATETGERERLWEARHHAYFAALALRPGCRVVSTDVCVPISRLAECVVATKADLAASGVVAPLVGHAGDGNFHLLVLVDPEDPVERERAAGVHGRLVERALALDGTCTGEHGVGLGKRRYLRAEHGDGVEVMRALKLALDPDGIFNPGKVLPDLEPSPAVMGSTAPDLSTIQSIADLETAARARLDPEAWEYLASGADDGRTVAANRSAWWTVELRARRLVDVSRVDTATTLFGAPMRSPIVVAPLGFQRLFWPDGELATARAAASRRHQMVLSSLATTAVAEVNQAAGVAPWFQLYPTPDRSVTQGLLARAEAAGCQVVFLTVDTPVFGNRPSQARTLPRLLANMPLANYAGLGPFESPLDPTMTWAMVGWLRAHTTMRIVLKGIVTAEDAQLAVEHGVDGVVVSNHGGRQLESGRATARSLPEVAAAIAGRMPVLVDGGIRRGTDIFAALALGADAVAVGRAFGWGLAAFGEAGVARALDLLHEELVRAMQLAGAVSLDAISRQAVEFAPAQPGAFDLR